MKTTLTHHVERRTYFLEWGPEELDVRPWRYSRAKRTWQPSRARVIVTREFEEVWTLKDADLFGLALKKDGTVGAQDVTENFYTFAMKDAPQQLQDAVTEILAFLNDPAVTNGSIGQEPQQLTWVQLDEIMRASALTDPKKVQERLALNGIKVTD